MSIFRRQKERPALLPADIVLMMTLVGRFEFDPQNDEADVNAVSQIFPRLHPLAQSNPDEFIAALAKAVLPVGGWAVYGGARTVPNLLGREYDHPDYRAMLSTALHFLQESGMSRDHLNTYEWEYWLEHEGGAGSWPS